MKSFTRPQLNFSQNSVDPRDVSVTLTDSIQGFSVDSNNNPTAEDGKTLPTGAYPRPFTTHDCVRTGISSWTAQLHFEPNAKTLWHKVFDARRAVIVPMVFTDGSPAPKLRVDMSCLDDALLPVATLAPGLV